MGVNEEHAYNIVHSFIKSKSLPSTHLLRCCFTMMVWERKKERKKEEEEDSRVLCGGMVSHFPVTNSYGLQDERIAGGELLNIRCYPYYKLYLILSFSVNLSRVHASTPPHL